jgi:ribonuclease-3
LAAALSHSDAELAQWARTRLGHDFKNVGYLREALIHGSATKGRRSYQRLEFLGDRVLGCIVATWLFETHDEPEGLLSSRFHALVEGSANAEVAREWQVSAMIEMEARTRLKGLDESDNVLGDVAEAIVAAIYLDQGWAAAESFVRREWARLLERGPRFLQDPKARLQQWAEKNRRGIPRYVVIDRQGPDHAPTFTIEASLFGLEPTRATGSTKQEAEKAAAAALFDQLPVMPTKRKRS